MAARRSPAELLVIVGPTASGKSDLAMKIAKEFDGEIITADSRTVYKGLDIGTAKPTKRDQTAITHWGIDLVEPGRLFTAADFKSYADSKIEDINARGKLPILVGGTGLYIDSVLFDFKFGPPADPERRLALEKLSVADLQKLIEQKGYAMPLNSRNKRHLIRAIEMGGGRPSKLKRLRYNAIIIGLWPPDEVLAERISKRAKAIFNKGVVEEYRHFITHNPGVPPEDVGIVYKICSELVSGALTEDEALEKFKTSDWQYARRQRTWFKRNPNIKWFADADTAEQYIKSILNT